MKRAPLARSEQGVNGESGQHSRRGRWRRGEPFKAAHVTLQLDEGHGCSWAKAFSESNGVERKGGGGCAPLCQKKSRVLTRGSSGLRLTS